MKNLAKKLSVGALSLMLLLPSLKAQTLPLSKEDSLALNNINNTYGFDYNAIGFPQKKVKKNVFEDPSLYGACVLGTTALFNINYARNHYALSEREHLVKTTTWVFIVGGVTSILTYHVADKIIDNRKKKKNYFLGSK